MFEKLIESLKLTRAYDAYRFYQNRKAYNEWERKERPVPPPPVVKQQIVKIYAENFPVDIFIETGTYLGEMVLAVKNVFKRIISVELDNTLAGRANKKFAKYNYITIIQGDSGNVLKDILAEIKKPCLFWLDSHYSGGLTAKSDSETPVMQELSHIFDHEIQDHVILIDDARCFNGENDYPALGELKDFVQSKRPEWCFDVRHDIIRIHKKTAVSPGNL
ncbi:hypothetical protein ACFL1R_09530 [Candidatus Latescibacterota bacterium]